MDDKNPIERENPEDDSLVRLFSYREKPLADEIIDAIAPKTRIIKPKVFPFVKVDDLNNQNENDDNRPKRALVIGIKGEF